MLMAKPRHVSVRLLPFIKTETRQNCVGLCHRVTQLAIDLAKRDAADIVLRGLHPEIRRHVLQQGSTSLEDITSEAVKAEAMRTTKTYTQFASLQSQLTDIQQKIQQVIAVNTKSQIKSSLPLNKRGVSF